MPKSRLRRTILIVLAGLVATAGVLYESWRPRPPLAAPVQSRPPDSKDETARLDNGMTLLAHSGGRKVMGLLAQRLIGMKDGLNLVQGVKELTLYNEKGEPIRIQADSGRLTQRKDKPDAFEVGLFGHVEVRTADDTALHTDELNFDPVGKVLIGPNPGRVTGKDLVLEFNGFTYAIDGQKLNLTGPLRVAGPENVYWRLDAGRAEYLLGSGRLVTDQPFRFDRFHEDMVSGPGTLTAPSDSPRMRLETEGPILLSGIRDRLFWQLAGGRMISAAPREKGPGPRELELGPPVLLEARGPSSRGTVSLEVAAETLKTVEGEAPRKAIAGPWFKARYQGPEPEPWTISGEWLEMAQDAAERLDQVDARGKVHLTGPNGASADAAALAWRAARPSEVLLNGEPARVRQGRDLVEAPRVLVNREHQGLTAEGNPLTEISSMNRGEGSMFRGTEPVRVRSSRVNLVGEDGPVEFAGPVQAWQGDTNLISASMRVQRKEQRLWADGDVVLLRTLGEAGKGNRRRVRLATQHLDFEQTGHVARLTGGALYEEPTIRVEAEEMTARLAPDGGIEQLDARGNVRVAAQGHKGRSDRLEWRGGAQGVVTLISERSLATLQSDQGSWRGLRVRYDLRDQKVAAEGGGVPTVTEGRPKDRPPQEKDPKR